MIVAADRRGEGVGETLMSAVVDHPALENVSLSLRCRRGLIPYYESVGFDLFDPAIEIPEEGTEELVLMRYSRED